MGEVTDLVIVGLVLEGVLCKQCGVFIVAVGLGYPTLCKHCKARFLEVGITKEEK